MYCLSIDLIATKVPLFMAFMSNRYEPAIPSQVDCRARKMTRLLQAAQSIQVIKA